jgi:hypothetical protein
LRPLGECAIVLGVVAPRSSGQPPPRRRAAVGVVGLVILVVLVLAYLSDCLPGLGAGGSLGTPAAEPTRAPAEPSDAAGQPARLIITVQGDRCRHGQAPAAPCPEVCAALPRDPAAMVEVEAIEGGHGTVEDLRQCLEQAGFAKVRVHSE